MNRNLNGMKNGGFTYDQDHVPVLRLLHKFYYESVWNQLSTAVIFYNASYSTIVVNHYLYSKASSFFHMFFLNGYKNVWKERECKMFLPSAFVLVDKVSFSCTAR